MEMDFGEFRERVRYASKWVLKLSMLSKPGSMKLKVGTAGKDAAGL
jgi:hypothetical protein